jgi:acetoin:2,6-dichlorophenolindophenol oxidoreductase subunit beta
MEITQTAAIKQAIDQLMKKDPSVFIIGEGVPDPKGIFGTTLGLKEKYPDRVLDMPISENGVTGVCIGAAVMGLRPIMTHQRIDFALLCMDQITNNASKWNYMFAGKSNVPIVIRLVIGRGWGQGPQHSQNLQALFAHIPGLKVVMPTTPYDAKGLLISAIEDNNPVIFIEHRWVHNLKGEVPEEIYKIPIGSAKIAKTGTDLTIAATSYMNIQALKVAEILEKQGISIEVVDVRSLKPLDDNLIIKSVKKTGNLLVLDSGWYTGGFAGEIISRISEKAFDHLKSAPQRITLPDLPTPTAPELTKHYYPTTTQIADKVLGMLNKDIKIEIDEPKEHDKPDPSFTGPF